MSATIRNSRNTLMKIILSVKLKYPPPPLPQALLVYPSWRDFSRGARISRWRRIETRTGSCGCAKLISFVQFLGILALHPNAIWEIVDIGDLRGARDTRPRAFKFFRFPGVSEKNCKIVCWPSPGELVPLILDPSLVDALLEVDPEYTIVL